MINTYKIEVPTVYCPRCKRINFKVLTENRKIKVKGEEKDEFAATAFCLDCKLEQRPFVVLLLLTAIRNSKLKPTIELPIKQIKHGKSKTT